MDCRIDPPEVRKRQKMFPYRNFLTVEGFEARKHGHCGVRCEKEDGSQGSGELKCGDGKQTGGATYWELSGNCELECAEVPVPPGGGTLVTESASACSYSSR